MGSSVPLEAESDYPYYTTWLFFISFVLWIPYTIVMFYFYYEHKKRNQSPQTSILLFLAMGCLLRTIWFLYAPTSQTFLSVEIINRAAVLFQFTAISLVMLMWSRSLNVSYEVDKARRRLWSQQRNEGVGRDGSVVSSTNSAAEDVESGKLVVAGKPDEMDNEYDKEENVIRMAMQDYAKMNAEKTLRRTYTWYAVNAIAWSIFTGCMICMAAGFHAATFYSLTAIFLAVLCLVVNFGICYVGIRSYLRLRNDLAPVYVCSDQTNVNTKPLRGFRKFFTFLWRRGNTDNQTFQLQEEILRTVLSVSFAVGLFFFLRSACFVYRYYYVNTTNSSSYPWFTYPLLFYQFPEFFPNIILAVGISPPNSFCRKLTLENLWLYFVAGYFMCCFVANPLDRARHHSVQRRKPGMYPRAPASMFDTAWTYDQSSDTSSRSASTCSDVHDLEGKSNRTSAASSAAGVRNPMAVPGSRSSSMDSINQSAMLSVGCSESARLSQIAEQSESDSIGSKDDKQTTVRQSFSIDQQGDQSDLVSSNPKVMVTRFGPTTSTSDGKGKDSSDIVSPIVGGFAQYMVGSTQTSRFTPRSTISSQTTCLKADPSVTSTDPANANSFVTTFGQYFRSPHSNSDWDNVERYY